MDYRILNRHYVYSDRGLRAKPSIWIVRLSFKLYRWVTLMKRVYTLEVVIRWPDNWFWEYGSILITKCVVMTCIFWLFVLICDETLNTKQILTITLKFLKVFCGFSKTLFNSMESIDFSWYCIPKRNLKHNRHKT